MIRTNTKIGDVFSVNITGNTKKYFQYIANDLTQLNSDVIRTFKKEYSINDNPELSEVVKGEIDFYAHCVTKFGLKLKLWEKVGNIAYNEKADAIFRDTNDYGQKLGDKSITISHDWYVWEVNGSFKKVGKLTGENRHAEIGIVVTPQDIIDRMKTGKYHFVYPDFE